MKIDSIDREIIRILEENARTSFRKIAKKLGLSPMAIVKRIRKLEEMGVIKKYTVILDPTPLGYNCSFCIFVRVKPGYDVEEIGRMISGFPETFIVNMIAGDYDLAVLTRCKDKEAIQNYISKINNIEGVERVNSYFVIKTIV